MRGGAPRRVLPFLPCKSPSRNWIRGSATSPAMPDRSSPQLPNYTVFDEERYFDAGSEACVIDVDGLRCGLVICEDCWFPGPARQAKAAGAQVIVVPNGSPYHTRQQALRRDQVSARARETG